MAQFCCFWVFDLAVFRTKFGDLGTALIVKTRFLLFAWWLLTQVKSPSLSLSDIYIDDCLLRFKYTVFFFHFITDFSLFLFGNLITNYIRMLFWLLEIFLTSFCNWVWQNRNFTKRNFPFIAGMSLECLKNGVIPAFPYSLEENTANLQEVLYSSRHWPE